jgi:hypothetical protein
MCLLTEKLSDKAIVADVCAGTTCGPLTTLHGQSTGDAANRACSHKHTTVTTSIMHHVCVEKLLDLRMFTDTSIESSSAPVHDSCE